MPGRIVLYGATGYMGGLTARAMVAGGAGPILADRDRHPGQSPRPGQGGRLAPAPAGGPESPISSTTTTRASASRPWPGAISPAGSAYTPPARWARARWPCAST